MEKIFKIQYLIINIDPPIIIICLLQEMSNAKLEICGVIVKPVGGDKKTRNPCIQVLTSVGAKIQL